MRPFIKQGITTKVFYKSSMYLFLGIPDWKEKLHQNAYLLSNINKLSLFPRLISDDKTLSSDFPLFPLLGEILNCSIALNSSSIYCLVSFLEQCYFPFLSNLYNQKSSHHFHLYLLKQKFVGFSFHNFIVPFQFLSDVHITSHFYDAFESCV